VTCCAGQPSFYLSLAILPRALREPSARLLLARASDNCRRHAPAAAPERLRHLATLGAAYAGTPGPEVAGVARAGAPLQMHATERELLERVGETLARVERLAGGRPDGGRAVAGHDHEGQRSTSSAFRARTRRDWRRSTRSPISTATPTWSPPASASSGLGLCVAHRPRLAGWDVAP